MKRLLSIVLLGMAIFVPAPHSEAATRITFVNRTDRNVHLAIYTDMVRPITQGWYSIDPGKTLLYETQENVWNVGYYAEGHASGKKTLYWEGDELLRGWVHQTEPFNLRGYPLDRTKETRTDDRYKQVDFLYINLTREIDKDDKATNFVATVTLAENPQNGKPRATE